MRDVSRLGLDAYNWLRIDQVMTIHLVSGSY